MLAVAIAGCITPRAPRPEPAEPTAVVVVPPPERAAPATAPPPAAVALEAPPPVTREFRAAWVTPLAGGSGPDWPSVPGLSPDSQRAELRALLDRAQAIGLNAVILHVRMAGDAIYPTPLAPWSAFLTGRSGVGPSPAYDPLAYAVEQAHARGLQLHAWFNPFRAMLPNFAGSAAASHVTRTHPEWIRRYGTQTWIDPGLPAARAEVLATILDVVRRYDVDGVHIDDYFYPYRESETIHRRVGRGKHRRRVTIRRDIEFPDDASWARYGRAAGYRDRDAWRRANIDDFVQRLYRDVKATKPWVLVGISPFGIWRSGTPSGVTGLDAYGEIYADSRRWLREGWLDYLVPQLYWPLAGEQHRFTKLEQWWQDENLLGRHVWPGLETAVAEAPRSAWPEGEIAAEITDVRDRAVGTVRAPGHVHFRIGSLGAGPGSLGERLRASLYAEPALVPASPWLERAHPAPPQVEALGSVFTVAPGDSVIVAWWLMQTRASDGTWTTRLEPATAQRFVMPEGTRVHATEIAVTAVNRAGEAGAPTVLPWPVAAEGAGGH